MKDTITCNDSRLSKFWRLTFGLFLTVNLALGQVTGPTPVVVNSTHTYTYHDGTTHTSTSWWAINGTVQSSWTEGNHYKVTVTWNDTSPGAILFSSSTVFNVGLSVEVGHLPTFPAAPAVTRNCGSTTLTRGTPPGGETWYWQDTYNGENTSPSRSGVSVTLTSGTVYYLRARSTVGLWSAPRVINYEITPIPSIPSAPTITNHCGSTTLTRTSAPADHSYYWQSAIDGTDTQPAAAATSVTLSSGTIYYLRSYNDNTGCWSAARAVNYSIDGIPFAPPESTVAVSGTTCGSTVLTRTGSPPGYNYYWQLTSDGEDISSSAASSTITRTSGEVIYLRNRSDITGCWSAALELSYSFNSFPPSPSLPDVFHDFGHTKLTKAGTPDAGVTWYWQGNASSGTSVLHDSSTYIATSPGTYYLRSRSSAGCWGGSVATSVTIDTIPDVTVTGNLDLVELGDKVILSTTGYDSYSWKRDGIEVGTGSSYEAGLAGSYTVKVTRSGYGGTSIPVVVTGCGTVAPEDGNYVLSSRLQIPVTDRSLIASLDVDNRNMSLQYFDGLGRLLQSVEVKASPSKRDRVQPVVYDKFGRQLRVYLPYVADYQCNSYRVKPVGNPQTNYADYSSSAHYQFYQTVEKSAHDVSPYAETVFEPSPLNRVKQQGAAGASWNITTGAIINFDYQVNETLDDVIFWEMSGNTLRQAVQITYAGGELAKTVTTNEEGHAVIEFVNKQGQTILKRVQVVENPNLVTYIPGEWADTYYIYDEFGDLRYVLPPEAVKAMGTPGSFPYTPSSTLLDRWAFRYDYDGRRRMIKKKVPGADTLYMVYDNRDRLILTQDGEQREQDEWLFTKYDPLNRPVLTGIHDTTVALTQREMQAVVDAHYSSSSVPFYETLGGNIHGYTNVTYPSQSDASRYLSATYYDDYGFQGTVAGFGSSFHYERPVSPAGCQTIPQDTYCYEDEAFNRVKGQVTGTKVKILGTDQWINTVTHYDDRYRVIQTVSTNEYLGVNTRTSQLYNFPGWLLETYKSQTRGSKTLGLRQRYSYDHAGRLLRGYHELYDDGVGQGEVLLAENRYNELGELIEKNLHVEGGVPAQSIDYRYNIRGWLESINNAQLTHDPRNDDSNDLFGMELIYESPLNGVPPVGN